MNEEFLIYEKFNSQRSAEALARTLEENSIDYSIENISIKMDPILSNNEFGKEYCVKIRKDDFEKLDSILQKQARSEIGNLQDDYPLLQFSDQELIEVLEKSDEWNKFDVELAHKLLKERGTEITAENLKEIRSSRIAELSKPDESQRIYIIVGYITAFLGGVLGVFIGWHLATFKKTLPNGSRVYAYSDYDRKQGNRILSIGVIAIIIYIFIYVILGILDS